MAADFVELQGEPPKYRCRCITAVVDGRVIGIGGLVHMPGGELWASVIMHPDARRFPLAIHRAGKAAIAMFGELGLNQVLAQPETGAPHERRWLQRLGFQPERHGGQEVFVWRRCR